MHSTQRYRTARFRAGDGRAVRLTEEENAKVLRARADGGHIAVHIARAVAGKEVDACSDQFSFGCERYGGMEARAKEEESSEAIAGPLLVWRYLKPTVALPLFPKYREKRIMSR